jgi:SAM-dependent methyltransferase
MNTNLVSLDLGCGSHPRNPLNAEKLFGVDISLELKNSKAEILRADLAIEKIPFPDRFFDCVTAFDFIEHIPRVLYRPNRTQPFVELMNEISRVLMPGGLLISSTPAYPHKSAFQDPTHVNIITENTFEEYFSVTHKNRARIYGYSGELSFEHQYWRKSKHIVTFMRKKINATDSTISSAVNFNNANITIDF